MPPIVEGRRREHRESAPRCHETSERAAKAPDGDARVFCFSRRAEGGRENRVATGNTGQYAREIDHHVRRSPERVAADRDMPRDVPVAAEQVRGGRGGETPDVPGNRSGAICCDTANVSALAKVKCCGGISHGGFSATIISRSDAAAQRGQTPSPRANPRYSRRFRKSRSTLSIPFLPVGAASQVTLVAVDLKVGRIDVRGL